MKVMTVVGTRPEAIKLAPVIAALRDFSIDTIVCSTGQHQELLAQALKVFSITPDISLNVMIGNQSLNQLTVNLISRLETSIAKAAPDWVLVQGDTTSAFAASLAAFYSRVKVAHVEAGLRTGDVNNPFPEEVNRQLIARLSNLHFAPTHAARVSLEREGVNPSSIYVTGNTIVDAINLIGPKLDQDNLGSKLVDSFIRNQSKRIILVTCHRRENFGVVFDGICDLLRRLANKYQDCQWIFPVHPNPNIREPVLKALSGISNISLIEPLDYISNLKLISKASLIVTDSGGIQEEAPTFGVPVVIMREQTERREGVDAGFARLAGKSAEGIETAIHQMLNEHLRTVLAGSQNPYGDGHASRRIVERLLGQEMNEFAG